MNKLLLPLLLLCLPAAAQYRPVNSPTYRPSYSPPAPSLYHPSTNPTVNYRVQQQQIQQAHQNFQQMQAQQRQQMQDQYYYRHRQPPPLPLRYPQSAEQLAQAKARQQQAEQQATEQLAHLAETQRQHQANPPATAAEAETQRREDARQLTQLTLKSYREVFLPGQLLAAHQALLPAPEAQQQLHALSQDLLDDTWWTQQDASQRAAKVAGYGTALTKISDNLLGFSAASLPPVPVVRSASAMREQLSQAPQFNQAAAAQLISEATQAEKRRIGERLAQAVQRFAEVSGQVAASPAATSPKALKQQRSDVQKSLRQVNKELFRYHAYVGSTGPLQRTQMAIMQATAGYLEKTKE